MNPNDKCNVYVLKSESDFDKFSSGDRSEQLYYKPPTKFNVTSDTLEFWHLQKISDSNVAYLIVSIFN